MPAARLFKALAILAAASPVGAMAQTSFTVPYVVDFEDPAFQVYYDHLLAELEGTVFDGKLLVESGADAGSCGFSSLELAADGTRATHVELDPTLAPSNADEELMHGAGLMIRYDLDSGSRFFAYLVQDRGYDLVAFVDGAVVQRIRGNLDDHASTIRLAAREAGGGAEFFLNGESIGSLADSRIQGTGIALIHCGPGRYVFDNWGINTRGDVGFVEAALGGAAGPADAIDGEPAGDGEPAVQGNSLAGGPPPVPEPVWWVDDNGTPLGPLSLPELRARLADGRSNDATLVWRDGMTNWTPAASALP